MERRRFFGFAAGGAVAMALKGGGNQLSQFMRLAFYRSPNYVAGTTGWTINQDGSAEFNNLTVRGTFYGTDYEIWPYGMFFYSGTPAAGNLIGSLFATQNDRFGNVAHAGVTSYKTAAPKSFAQLTAGQLLFGGGPNTVADGSITDTAGGSMTLQTSTANVSPGDVAAVLILQAKNESNDGTSPEAVFSQRIQVQTPAGGPGSVFTVDPANPNTDENWHAITPQNGWANSGSGPHFKCRLVASPPNSVEIIGDLTAGTLTNATVVGALPSSAYFPASNQQLMLVWPGTPPTSPGAGRLFVSTAGNIEAEDLAGAAGRCYFHGFVSLDA